MSNDDNQNEPNRLVTIIEKCPICGKIYKGQSNYCELCGQQFPSPIEIFFKKTTHYFAILSVVGVLISLLPLFLDIIIGSNWLNQLLGRELGFFCLLLLLITTNAGALFMFVILCFIIQVFRAEVLKTEKLSLSMKLIYSFFMVIGGIAFFSLIGFLLLVWLTKSDIAIFFTIYLIVIAGAIVYSIVAYSVISLEILHKNEAMENGRTKKYCIIGICVFFIIIAGIFMLPIVGDISGYYSQKTIIVVLTPADSNITNNTPPIILLTYSLPNVTGSFSLFDINYAQCHWSTNYGYFLTMNQNTSSIKKYQQEVIIPRCPYSDEKIYWTYDVSDYKKQKPPVYIGFTIEDVNKKQIIGENNTVLHWTERDTDTIILDNNTLKKP